MTSPRASIDPGVAVRKPFADSPEFRRLLDGEADVGLARIALEIARDANPGLDVEAQIGRIDALAERVRQRCALGAGPRAILGQVNWVLFVEEGFRGNEEEYDDPRNSYLDEVLDRKTGIPISLSILYAAVASPSGVALAGVNLPAHFVLRLDGDGPPTFIDAFRSGALLDRLGCERLVSEAAGRSVALTDGQLAAVDAPAIVARMLRNLKGAHLRDDDYAAALPVVRRLAALVPDDLTEQRDWGLLAYRAGRAGESVAPLTRYTEGRPDAVDTAAVVEILRAARRDVARSN